MRGRNEILQALTRGRGDRAAIKAHPARARGGRARGRRRPPRAAPGRAAKARPARPCSTSPASTPMAICCWRTPIGPSCGSSCRSRTWSGTAPASATASWPGCSPAGEGAYEARPIRILPQPAARGRPASSRLARDGLRIRSADRKARAEFVVAQSDLAGAAAGRSRGGGDPARSPAGSCPRHGHGAGRPVRTIPRR